MAYAHNILNTHIQRVVQHCLSSFAVSTLLGLIVDAIHDFLDSIKRGTRAVVEQDHIVILGLSPKVVAIIIEACNALESEGGRAIVLMDDLDRNVIEVCKCKRSETRGNITHTPILCQHLCLHVPSLIVELFSNFDNVIFSPNGCWCQDEVLPHISKASLRGSKVYFHCRENMGG
jgi:hypothetical protein